MTVLLTSMSIYSTQSVPNHCQLNTDTKDHHGAVCLEAQMTTVYLFVVDGWLDCSAM